MKRFGYLLAIASIVNLIMWGGENAAPLAYAVVCIGLIVSLLAMCYGDEK